MASTLMSTSTSASGSAPRSPPSPHTPQRPLTPPPRRPRTPTTPAPSSPRVSTVPLPDISPGPGPVPITVTGPSTPVAGIFGMMGLNLEPGQWSIGSPVQSPSASGHFTGLGQVSLPPSGAGTPTRSHAHAAQAMSPAGLMALHNSFEKYEREREQQLEQERHWVATTTSTPTTSTQQTPEGSPLRSLRAVSLPLVTPLHLPDPDNEVHVQVVQVSDDTSDQTTPTRPDTEAHGPGSGSGPANGSGDGDGNGSGKGPASSPSHSPAPSAHSHSPSSSPSPLHSPSRGPAALPHGHDSREPGNESNSNNNLDLGHEHVTCLSPTQSMPSTSPILSPTHAVPLQAAFPLALQTPRVLDLDEVRARRADGVLMHWPAVTRVAGHTVIHRAVPGKPEEGLFLDLVCDGDDLWERGRGRDTSATVSPSPFSSSPPAEWTTRQIPSRSLSASRSRSGSIGSIGTLSLGGGSRRASVATFGSSRTRRPSRPALPAIFGVDLAGPLVARIARSKATGTPEAWWAWGAPAIRSAAWGVLEDEPIANVQSTHAHANTTVTTSETTVSTTEVVETQTRGENATSTSTQVQTRTTTQVTTTQVTTSCACNDSPLTWGEGGGFTTRLGSFVFAPPFEEGEAAELRDAAATAAIALTVCDGSCGCDSIADTAEEGDSGNSARGSDSTVRDLPTVYTDDEGSNDEEPKTIDAGIVPVSTEPIKLKSKETTPTQSTAASRSQSRASRSHSRSSSTADQLEEVTTSLLGLSLSFARPSIRLSMPSFGADKGAEREEQKVSGTMSEPASSPPSGAVPMPEPMSPRSRRLGSVFGLSPRKKR